MGKGRGLPSEAGVKYSTHPDGEAHVRDTLRKMGKLAHDRKTGGHSLAIRQWATRAVHDVPSKDQVGELAALYRWVRDHIRYRNDPHGLEWLQSPTRTLNERAGDCDDMAILLAAGAVTLGRAVRFRIMARRPGRWQHVWVEANAAGRWIPLDPVIEPQQPTTAARDDLGRFGRIAAGRIYTKTFNAQGAPMGLGNPVGPGARRLWGYGVPYFPQQPPLAYPRTAGRGGLPPRPDLAYRSPGSPGPRTAQLLWSPTKGQHVARPAGLSTATFNHDMWDPSDGDFRLGRR